MHRFNSFLAFPAARRSVLAVLLLAVVGPLLAEVTRIDISERETLSDPATDLSYESIVVVLYF
jgi:hypothetical protein